MQPVARLWEDGSPHCLGWDQNLISQMSKQQGVGSCWGRLDPTQCLGRLSLVTVEPPWCRRWHPQ